MEKKLKFKKFISSTLGKIALCLLFYTIILLFIVMCVNLNIEFLMVIVAAVCIFFGWKSLNRLTSNIFLILPLVGWLVYFFVKFFLSVLVGFFVAPFVISKWIVQKIETEESNKNEK